MSTLFSVALLEHVRSTDFNVQQVRGSLTADQARNAIDVFLLIFRTLWSGGFPTRNAGLVAAKLGETGYGTVGANAPIRNWFSAQPAPTGSQLNGKQRACKAAFEKFPGFEGWDSGQRAVDDTTSAGVLNPTFRSTDFMVEAQLFLVYGLGPDPDLPAEAVMFPGIGAALRDQNTKYTALQFGLVVQNAGYGPGYGTNYASWYATLRRTLTLFLNYVRDGGPKLDGDLATEATQWAVGMLTDLPS
jgi:hypothetical protein